MPRGREVYYNYADISLKEFADAKVAKPNGRIRKKVIGHAIKSNTSVDEIDESIDDPTETTRKMKKGKIVNNPEEDHSYNVYPNDVWYLISEQLEPGDVGRFALICKQTYAITTSMKFWRNLYRRYYDRNVELPVRLQWDCMTRPGGIRACTIRSLFFTYAPFVNSLRQQAQQDFHTLVKRRVVHFWYQIADGKFVYFYKLKRKLVPGTKVHESGLLQRHKSKSMKALRDVYLNTEEGCTLLMVESTKFHPLPRLEIMEHESSIVLSSIVNHLSRDCTHYRLEITFANITGAKIASISYEPATSIKVYDWWVPTYSKYVRQGIQPSLEYLREEKPQFDDNTTDDDAWDYVINNY